VRRKDRDELKDVKPLAVWAFGGGVLFTKDVVLKKPEDCKGLKLRASNRQTNDAFAMLGAQPLSIPPPGVPEALAKVPPKLGFYSMERGYYLNNYLFDYLASRSIPESNVIHFVNSIGLITARRSKRWGAKVICDSRQEHPLFHEDVLKDEAARLGVVATCIQNLSYRDKMLREFELADHIVVPSEHAKRTFLERGFHLDKVHVLNYGVESDLFYPNRNTDGVFRVLYVGQITYRKGIQYLLEAFTKLNLSNAELKLVGAIDPGFRPILARYEGRFTHVPQLARVDLHWLVDVVSAILRIGWIVIGQTNIKCVDRPLPPQNDLELGVFLRRPGEDDRDEFLAMVQASRHLYAQWIHPPARARDYEAFLVRSRHRAVASLLVCRQPDGLIVGVFNLNEISPRLRTAFCSYYVHAGFAGQGLMTEGLQLLLRHAFVGLQLQVLGASIQPGNLA